MIVYCQLTQTKQLAVDVIVRSYPETMKTGKIALKDLRYLFDSLKEKRKETGFVIGFPIWLTTDKQFRTNKRGVYKIPLPREIKQNLTSERQYDTITFNRYTPKTFKQELIDAGIDVININF